jgi:hypothetical protein
MTEPTQEIVLVASNEIALPRATHSGNLTIGNAQIKCFVVQPLDEEEPLRLLSGRTVTKAFGLLGRGPGMRRFIEAEPIAEKMSERAINAIENPIQFNTKSSGLKPAFGYPAWLLPELCFAIMDANEEKPLPAQQKILVTQAKILSRAFAVVGIDALVDEATGYQEVRDRMALQKILEKYVSKEMLAYVKMFPDDFYKEMFRLLGWQWKGMSVGKPSYVGKLTDELIYKRLDPPVRAALFELTPRDSKGRLTHKLHQHLTPEEGKEALRKHLYAVIALMRASTSWRGFMSLMQRAFPAHGETLPMFSDFDDK